MAGKAAMAKPTKHVPAYTPARHADREFGFGAVGAPPTLARGVWTAHQTVDHLRRTLVSFSKEEFTRHKRSSIRGHPGADVRRASDSQSRDARGITVPLRLASAVQTCPDPQ